MRLILTAASALLLAGCYDEIRTDIGSISPTIAMCESDLAIEGATATVDTFDTAGFGGMAAVLVYNPARDRVTVLETRAIPEGGGEVTFADHKVDWEDISEGVPASEPFLLQVWVDVGNADYKSLIEGDELTVDEYAATAPTTSLMARTTSTIWVDCRNSE